MNPTIISAIRNNQCLSFNYDGYQRVVEPHAYGVSSKGKEIMRAFQVQGGHVSGHKDGWHLFSIEKINFLTNTGESFSGARNGYRRGDSAMSTIYSEL